MATERQGRSSGLILVVLGAAAVAVCCAGVPLLIAALGGLTLAAVLGIGAGAVVLGVITFLVAILVRTRRARHCDAKEHV